jgi:hypothetical protein
MQRINSFMFYHTGKIIFVLGTVYVILCVLLAHGEGANLQACAGCMTMAAGLGS